MSGVQGSRTGTRSATRTGTRSSSKSTSAEPPKPARPQATKRPPVPRGPTKPPVQSIAERRQAAEETRKAVNAAIIEQEYEERSKIRTGRIDALMLRFITREELKGDDFAVCEVTDPSVNLSANMMPKTLYDMSMGPYDHTGTCSTCRNVGTMCGGHFGKILFKRPSDTGELIDNPIYNTMYIDTLIQVLNCICSDCAHLLIPADYARSAGFLNLTRARRLKKFAEESKKMRQCSSEFKCVSVARPYGKSKSDQGLIVRHKGTKKGDDAEPIYPMMAYNLLKQVSDEDMRTLGFEVSRPEETLIFFGVLVTPPITRVPRIIGNEYQIDDITERYRAIVSANEAIKAKPFPSIYSAERQRDPEIREILIQKHYHMESRSLSEKVVSIVHPAANVGSKRPIGSLFSIISSKQGVFRAILNAKTGDFCARSVASPGINLEVDQIGIPIEWASKLTPQEIVFQGVDPRGKPYGNKEKLQQLLEEGKVTRVERKRVFFTITPAQTQGENRFILESGDKILRHLENNDSIIVNRNPSLHKQSLLYHRVKLIPGLSIKLPLPTTPGYNADFDGDELNLFLVQDIEARSEALLIMTVGESLLSESSGTALIAPTFNAPLGVYLLTLPKTHLTFQDFQDVFYATRPDPNSRNEGLVPGMGSFLDRCKKHGVNPLSGKGIFSIILPPNLNYESKTKAIKSFLRYKAEIVFKSGETRVVYSEDQQTDKTNYSIEELKKLGSKFTDKDIPESFKYDFKTITTPYNETVYNEGEEDEYKIILSVVEAVEDEIIIRDGILIRGTLSKNAIGQGGDLLTYFYREFKSSASLVLINSIDFIANWFLQNKYAFSIGIDDVFDVQTVRRYTGKFEEELKKIFHKVELIAKPLKSELDEAKRQASVIDLLSKVSELSFTLTTGADSGYQTSNIKHAIQSGAKGKVENLSGSLMSIGIQLKQGSLISPAYGQSRYSPFFPENIYTAESLGYCRSSLSEGFTPAEALPITSAARGDLATMKLGTPTGGYTQRRLTNLMGNLITNSVGSVMNGVLPTSGMIQSIYADCGFEAKNLYRISTDKGEILSPVNMKQLAFQ